MSASRGHQSRSSAAARFPSPPPPPQQRRLSLNMSLPLLEDLLTQAPPADLSTGQPPPQQQLRARRSFVAATALPNDPISHFGLLSTASAPISFLHPPASDTCTANASFTTSNQPPPCRRLSSRIAAASRKKPPPDESLSDSSLSTAQQRKRRRLSNSCGKLPAVTEACCICMTVPTACDLAAVSGCAHSFCFGCITTWSETENSCPLCKSRFTSISRAAGGIKSVEQRNQRSEAGIALDSLLQSLAGGGAANLRHHHLNSFLLRSLGGGGGGTGEDDDPFWPGLLNVVLRSSTVTTTHTTTLSYPSAIGGRTVDTAIEIDEDDEDEVQVLDELPPPLI